MVATSVAKLTDLLAPPDRYEAGRPWPPAKWRAIPSEFGHLLVEAFGEAAEHDFRRWEGSLRRWLAYSQAPWWREANQGEWVRVARLLGCARRALSGESRVAGASGLSRSGGSTDSEDQVQVYEGWFRLMRSGNPRPVIVPVSLYDQDAASGYVADLTLVLVPGAPPCCVRHPSEAFELKPADDSFTGGLVDALAGALRIHADADSAPVAHGVVWALAARNKAGAALEPTGRSASGAAAYGLALAIAGRIPDGGVLAIAEVDRDDNRRLRGTLDGDVNKKELEAKVRGVAEQYEADKSVPGVEPIDTIVVATQAERVIAEATLRSRFKGASPIRVVLP